MKQTHAHKSAKPTADAQSAATDRVKDQVTNSRASFGLPTTPMGGGCYMAQFGPTDQV